MIYSLWSAAEQIYTAYLKPGRLSTVQHWRFLVAPVILPVDLFSSVDPSGVVFVCMLLQTRHSMLKFGELQQIADIYGFVYCIAQCKSQRILKSIFVFLIWHLQAQQSMQAGIPMTHCRDIVDAQNAGGCIIVCGDHIIILFSCSGHIIILLAVLEICPGVWLKQTSSMHLS